MSRIEKLIKIFDIYGSRFTLRINNQAKFRSVIGGLLSLFTMAILLFCFISFGHDFYNRINPKIAIEEGLFQDEDMPILQGDDYSNRTIIIQLAKASEKLFLPYVYSVANNTITKEYLPICSTDYLVSEYLVASKTDKSLGYFVFYCFQPNKFPLNGNFFLKKNQTRTNLVLGFDECKNILDGTIKQKGLACDKNYNNAFKEIAINFYFESLGFIPEKEDPFIKKYNLYSFILCKGETAYFDMLLSVMKLKDDLGWIIPYNFNKTELTVQDVTKTNVTPNSPNIPNMFINLYLSDKYKTYSRTYSKLQDLLASVGGFMKLIMTVLNLFNLVIKNLFN